MVVSNKMMNSSKKEFRDMAARICRDYLNGSWKEVTGKDIGLSRVTGGLSNWLYLVKLPAHLPPVGSEPSQVLLRLYGQMHGERALEGLITESVIFTLLSERRLGPSLHGVFPGGRIEEYIEARSLQTLELANSTVSPLIAQKMALIHAMNVPISKEPTWLWDMLSLWLQTALENLNSPGSVRPENQKAVAQLQTYDLASEVEWLKHHITKTNYPVVFCHNDLQEGNLLLPQEDENLVDPKLVLIDFEYCSYNYRGFDLANHFMEWMYDYKCDKQPYFIVRKMNYPTIEQKLLFIRSYRRSYLECKPMTADAELNEQEYEEMLLREIEVFSLASHLLWGLWSIVNAKLSDIPFGYWDYAKERLGSYISLKEKSSFRNMKTNDS